MPAVILGEVLSRSRVVDGVDEINVFGREEPVPDEHRGRHGAAVEDMGRHFYQGLPVLLWEIRDGTDQSTSRAA